jgi:hypothetical protein
VPRHARCTHCSPCGAAPSARLRAPIPPRSRARSVSAGGCIVNCCDKGGCGCLRVPFYIYPPNGKEDEREGHIVKIWTGIARECCTLANNFEYSPPKSADGASTALIYGATILLDYVRTRTPRSERGGWGKAGGGGGPVYAALA